ncbi:hypothetical protein ACFE04_027182 [Oxalis oulophora]
MEECFKLNVFMDVLPTKKKNVDEKKIVNQELKNEKCKKRQQWHEVAPAGLSSTILYINEQDNICTVNVTCGFLVQFFGKSRPYAAVNVDSACLITISDRVNAYILVKSEQGII